MGLYVWEIVRLHRLPNTIVSDWDTKFTSMFWREVHRMLGVKLLMSMEAPQTMFVHRFPPSLSFQWVSDTQFYPTCVPVPNLFHLKEGTLLNIQVI